MLDINSEEIKKFKKEIEDLTLSMQSLKQNSVVSLKVSAPSEKSLERIEKLKGVLQDFKTGDFSNLSSVFSGLSNVKSLGTSSIVRDVENLSNLNVSSAIGNLRDITVAYGNLQESIASIDKANSQNQQNRKNIDSNPSRASSEIRDFIKPTTRVGDEAVTSVDKPSSQNQQSKGNNNNPASGSFSEVSKFIRTAGKADPDKITSVIESLKGLNDIKVDKNTSMFMENAARVRSFNLKSGSSVHSNSSNSRDRNVDISSVITTTLSLLGSGIFLKRQASVAKEVTDLLSLSEITGLDSFSNRAGFQALGMSPSAVANQQRSMSRELIGARLFGDVDPRRLILHNLLGTNFQSSQKEMLAKSLKLSPKMRDYVLSQLGGDELALGASRLSNAYKGANKSQTQSLNSLVFGDSPQIDVGSYTRFYIHFEGFFAQTKTFFQMILQPSIGILESSFERANNTIRKLMNNKKAISSLGQILSSFVGAVVSVFELVADGLVTVGNLIVKYDLVEPLSKAASVLGYVVAGGLIVKTIGLATTFFTSLLGIRTLMPVIQGLLGFLGGGLFINGNNNTKGGQGIGKGGGAVGNLARTGAGVVTVMLASNTIQELAKLFSMTSKPSSEGAFVKDDWAQLLKTTGSGTAAVGTAVAATGAGAIPGLIMAAIGAGLYGAGSGLENSEQIVAALNSLIDATLEQNRNIKDQKIVLETRKGSNGEVLIAPIKNQMRN